MIKNIDNLLEKRLAAFAADKSKENYVSLLYAFRYTDVLVPAAVQNNPELPFGNAGVLKHSVFKPDIVYFNSLNKRLMPVFSSQKEIPADYKAGKAVFMHCLDWIKAARLSRNDGVILNPFSALSFVLTPDQIKILLSFPEEQRKPFVRRNGSV